MDQLKYVVEHVLYPTLSWTSFYHYTNPLSLPLYNNPDDKELCQTQTYHLTSTPTAKQFTDMDIINHSPKANRFSIDYYDHSVTRANEHIFLDDDKNANLQITEKFFIPTQ